MVLQELGVRRSIVFSVSRVGSLLGGCDDVPCSHVFLCRFYGDFASRAVGLWSDGANEAADTSVR